MSHLSFGGNRGRAIGIDSAPQQHSRVTDRPGRVAGTICPICPFADDLQ